MQEVPVQEAVYPIYDMVCIVGDETDVLNPEFARIGHNIG
jgi:hypothetical protein